jgi:hypothetical protein
MLWWQQPFFLVAPPIIVAVMLGAWYQSGRINDLRDSLGKRIDDLRSDMNTRFGAVEKRLDKLEEKVEGLMERSWR